MPQQSLVVWVQVIRVLGGNDLENRININENINRVICGGNQ